MKKSICVCVVGHKEFELLSNDSMYKKMAVGSLAKGEKKPGYLYDSDGENISDKNDNYCELTAHYWIWKNSKADIVGLCHYRRYLSKYVFSNSLEGIIASEDIFRDLKKYDIILPYRNLSRRSVKEVYCVRNFQKDLDILREILHEKYPDYLNEFDRLMKRHSDYGGNILICTKKIFDEYSKWLFDILFEVERRTDLTGYTDYQKRIYGYMSERLLDLWVSVHRIKAKHYRMIKTDQSEKTREKITEILGMIITNMKL